MVQKFEFFTDFNSLWICKKVHQFEKDQKVKKIGKF